MTPVDPQDYDRREREDAVGDEIFAEPVEAGADQTATDDDRQSELGIEILADVEVPARADRTRVNARVAAKTLAE